MHTLQIAHNTNTRGYTNNISFTKNKDKHIKIRSFVQDIPRPTLPELAVIGSCIGLVGYVGYSEGKRNTDIYDRWSRQSNAMTRRLHQPCSSHVLISQDKLNSISNDCIRTYLQEIYSANEVNIMTLSEIVVEPLDFSAKDNFKYKDKVGKAEKITADITQQQMILNTINDNIDLFNSNVARFATDYTNPQKAVANFIKNITEMKANFKKYSKLISNNIPLSLLHISEGKDGNEFLTSIKSGQPTCKSFNEIDLSTVNLFTDITAQSINESNALGNLCAISLLKPEQRKVLDIINNNFDLFNSNVYHFAPEDVAGKKVIDTFADNITKINILKGDTETREKYSKLIEHGIPLFLTYLSEGRDISEFLESIRTDRPTFKSFDQIDLSKINLLKNITDQSDNEGKMLNNLWAIHVLQDTKKKVLDEINDNFDLYRYNIMLQSSQMIRPSQKK